MRTGLLSWFDRVFQSLLLVGFCCCAVSCSPLIQPPTPAAAVEESDARLIVQVTYPTVDLLNALAGELDIWEVDRAAQTFVARITLPQYDELLRQALPIKLDCAKMRQYAQDVKLTQPSVAKVMAEQCPGDKP